MKLDDVMYWTDSTVVLQYIKNTGKRFHAFVANCVATILDQASPMQWCCTDIRINPTNDASRGLKVDQLLSSSR